MRQEQLMYAPVTIRYLEKRNLMNSKEIKELDGVRLAFAQGGPDGFKLILLTPPVKSEKYRNCCELKWEPDGAKFFKYKNAPLLIDNKKIHERPASDFPAFMKMLQTPPVERGTWAQEFSSKFRSKRKQLPNAVALDIIKKYSAFVKSSPKEHFTSDYTETMHEKPPIPDNNRKETYQNFIRKAKTAKTCKCRCKKKSC